MPESMLSHFFSAISTSLNLIAKIIFNSFKLFINFCKSIVESIVNFLFFRALRGKRLGKKLLDCLESETAEGFLAILLNLMSLMFFLDRDYRRNIKGFQGKYLFKSRDNSIVVSSLFKNGNMTIAQKEIDDPNITVIFKDSRALMDFLLSPKPDILGSVLRQDITLDGNLNYLYKFAFMATHLRIMATNLLTQGAA